MSEKHILKFQTLENYKTAKKNHLVIPNISKIVETSELYINSKFVSKENAEAGDIIAYHEHSTGEREIAYIKPEAFDSNDTYWIADAVVVVPYSHTGDGTVRAMGLKYANITTPLTGGAANNIIWGAFVEIGGIEQNSAAINFSDYTQQETSSTYAASQPVSLPSDSFVGEKVNPYDTYTTYLSNSSSNYAPSPYNSLGGKNNAYFSTGSFSVVTNNSLKDMNGRTNTENILKTMNQTYLSETLFAETLSNLQEIVIDTNTINLFPAVSACVRYGSTLKPCTFDTTKTLTENLATMPWYLPSIGEIGYYNVRKGILKYALNQIGTSAAQWSDNPIWSSSTLGTNNSWYSKPSSGQITLSGAGRQNSHIARPFVAF